MKRLNLKTLLFLIITALTIVIAGCSEQDNHLSGAHPPSWADPESPDFHGVVAMNRGVASCIECHGDDLDGGEVEVSCIDCHRTQNICISCHGGLADSTGAPPYGLRNEIDDTTEAVGAHYVHLHGDELTEGYSCNICHLYPLNILDESHFDSKYLDPDNPVDSIAEINFSDFPFSDSTVWDSDSLRCENVYCHGQFSGGDSTNNPIWNQPDQALCGSCHDVGESPVLLKWKHEYHVTTAGLECNMCHALVVDENLTIITKDLHVNGLNDFEVADETICEQCHLGDNYNCTGCHGGLDNQSGAPPYALNNDSLTSQISVGAHTVHVEGSEFSNGFSCEPCHIPVNNITDSTHIDNDNIAEISFGNISGENANWNKNNSSCDNVYCHGDFNGGSNSSPVWTSSGQVLCGSCHDVGSNPAQLQWKHQFHIAVADINCSICHATVVDSLLNLVNLSLHINGLVEVNVPDSTSCNQCHGEGSSSCVGCHGGLDNQSGAPPYSLNHDSLTSQISVGAHTTHLEGGNFSDPLPCNSCHLVPSELGDSLHIDADNIAEIKWGGIAGDNSIWNRNNASCSNSYCHGNFVGGNNANVPIWTGSNQALCGSCHDDGSNPAQLKWKHEFHLTYGGQKCSDCHSNVINANNEIIDFSLHINGMIDTTTAPSANCSDCHQNGAETCTICHGGSDNLSGAPPVSISGSSNVTEISVGAHTLHVDGELMSDGVACSSCHTVPVEVLDDGHILDNDSLAEINFSGISGNQSNWDRITAQCSNSYCHGNFEGGNKNNMPLWTSGSSSACGSCHDDGSNPQNLKWKHEFHIDYVGLICNDCHASVVDNSLNIIDKSLHINGQVDNVNFDQATCDVCHDPNVVGSCVNSQCHGGLDNQTGAPPYGIEDETQTSELEVGAHTAHLEGNAQMHPVPCFTCHVVPINVNDLPHFLSEPYDNIAEITWGGIAGASATWNRTDSTCSDTYCHGDFRGGNAANIPKWTGTNQAICGSCHDVGSNPSTLRDKHEKHVSDKNIKCYECHSTTVDVDFNIISRWDHVDSVNTVSFSSGQGNYDGTTSTCSNIICHGPKDW